MNHLQPLDKKLRSQLENTVKKARDIAEEAALAVLEQLGVGEKAKPSYLNDAQQNLRVRLRAHARSLGDARKADGEQSIERLQEEVAYEHWHRMLFARFLAENNLLMYPDPDEPVAISLEECEDLAADEGAANGWELAGRYASQMLPQIFRVDSPVFELKLAPNHQLDLEKLLISLPTEVFTASDSLGWVYQFWQANNKERINKSEVKIGARELPAVTQLFTEPYMVSFLLDNSLGAWWAARRLTQDDLKNASSEEELRQKAAIDGVPLEYLRFVQGENGTWEPASGKFEAWPEQLSALSTLDPSCGSGHFLVAAFNMLVPLRMELEQLDAQEATNAVLRDNIHGLELDQRCVELAAFALALNAWKYPKAGGYRVLPEIQVACSGLAINAAKEEWKQLATHMGGKQNLSIAMDWLHDNFKDAPVLGSLMNPAKSKAAGLVSWQELSEALDKALATESAQASHTNEQHQSVHENAVVAQGMAKAAKLLASQYQWVITNVPYLSSGKQHTILQEFCEHNYPTSKLDLATVFLERCLEFCKIGGTSTIVIPQNWLFLTSYKYLRQKLLQNNALHLIARLGAKAFQTPMWDFNVQLICLSKSNSIEAFGDLFGESNSGNSIRGVDVSACQTYIEKSDQLRSKNLLIVDQDKQIKNPDARITLEDVGNGKLLSEVAICPRGIVSGDGDKWSKQFWEIIDHSRWCFFQGTTSNTAFYSGLDKAIDWSTTGDGMLRPGRDNLALGKSGVNVSLMRNLPVTLFLGGFYDQTTASITPETEEIVSALYSYCSSEDYASAVRAIDQKLNVTPATLVKVPFDLEHWTKVAAEKYPHGLPQPYTNDPTQWIFHGHPCGSVVWDEAEKWTAHGALRSDETVLHIAVARLLGYRWPAELDAKMELADEQREWVQRCEALLPLADEDGIVCIPAVRGEALASDRLINLLAAAYGDAWTPATLNQLLSSVGFSGKTLDAWLRDKFFEQHVKLFQNRPFIWHIWDGLNDGFVVLINYHKFDQKLLETLIYTYLGDWIKRQKDEIAAGVDGAQERLAAAEALRKRLIKILEGEAPLDIFVRWKPLEQQPIGWNPDLNDGVRLNIRPFILVDDVKVKGAGVLRNKIASIKWTKDRGADVESAPWYHLGPQYGGKEGDRINEHHLSLAEKKAAREKLRESS
ncbi:Eco57I restriction-modification methylase domain-containing protein [Shewanella algae]|uniref:Eco57I restriction-modification methylase domain-containing protein n=1 Tax=Shewanella algae TaxID=38313 RepID=UPI003005B15F